jgi:hypothetical protein
MNSDAYPVKINDQYKKNSLITKFEKNIKNDCLVDVPPEELQKEWSSMPHYTFWLDEARRLAKVYDYLQWDEELEKEIIAAGRATLLAKIEQWAENYLQDAPLKDLYTLSLFRMDLIIKRDIIKHCATGTEIEAFTEKIDEVIKKLRELENEKVKKNITDDIEWHMKYAEEAAKKGEYCIYVSVFEYDDDSGDCRVKTLDGLWEKVATHAHKLKRAEESAQQYFSLTQNETFMQNFRARSAAIMKKGNINVVRSMVTAVSQKKDEFINRINNENQKEFDRKDSLEELYAMHAIIKLLEEGKIGD